MRSGAALTAESVLAGFGSESIIIAAIAERKLNRKFQFVDLIWEQKTAKDFVSLAAFFSKLEPGENLHQHIYALLHILHRDILEPSVVVLAAGA